MPPDNPFVGRPAARPEIWRYGLRNPWRFSFDRATGDLWIGDVGQNEWEEIDRLPATNGRDAGKGVNFGWNRLGGHRIRTAGPRPATRSTPVYEISHDTGACAVVGGYVYRGTRIPSLAANYLFTDSCDAVVRVLVPDAAGGVTMQDTGAADGGGVDLRPGQRRHPLRGVAESTASSASTPASERLSRRPAQSKTTVRRPWTSTRCSTWARTAAGEDDDLEVAAVPLQVFDRVAVADAHDVLVDDRARRRAPRSRSAR